MSVADFESAHGFTPDEAKYLDKHVDAMEEQLYPSIVLPGTQPRMSAPINTIVKVFHDYVLAHEDEIAALGTKALTYLLERLVNRMPV